MSWMVWIVPIVVLFSVIGVVILGAGLGQL